MKKILLFDGTNLLHRSHHALLKTDLRDREGNPVWAVHGLILSIISFAKKFEATNVVVTFDTPGGSAFRKELHPLYKANRGESNSGINYQLSLAYVILSELGVSTVAMQHEEADDLLASLATQSMNEYDEIIVVSNDRDCYQLINEKTKVLKTNSELVDNLYVREKYGIEANDYKVFAAFRGEPGDNIEGIKGIGEVKAAKIINSLSSYENLAQHEETLKELLGTKLASNVVAQQELLDRNLKLVELKRNLVVVPSLQRSKLVFERDTVDEVLGKHNLWQVKKKIYDYYF